MRPINNSTLGSRDLTKDEIAKMRLVNFGTKPLRAKKGTSEKSKNRYKTTIEKAAGVTPGTVSKQAIKGEQHAEHDPEAREQETTSTEPYPNREAADKAWDYEDGHDELYEDEDDRVADEPAAFSIQCNDAQQEISMAPDASEAEAREQEVTSTESYPYKEAADKAWSHEDDHDELYEDQDHHVPDAPAPSIQENNNREEDSMIPAMTEAASRRYFFRFTEPPLLRGMTEQEALTHPHLDRKDPRNHVPKSQIEVQAISDALQTTRDHFQEIMGFESKLSWGSNYVSEYYNIRDQMPISIRPHIKLRRRKWVGTVFDWETGQVVRDP